jgi:hypothetical protein
MGVVLSTGPSPFPPRLTARLPWNYITGLSAPGSSVTGLVTYRLNGPYDPDTSVGGGQATGFDQLKGIYDFYRVVRAHVKLVFCNPSTTDYFGGYRIRPSTAGAGNGLDWQQFSDLPNAVLTPVSTSGNRRIEYRFSVDINTMFGVTRQQLEDDPNFRSAVAATPVNELDLEVVAYSYAGTPSCTVAIQIEYETVFSQRARLYDA